MKQESGKKFKVKITEVFYVMEDEESFGFLRDAAKEGDMQYIHETEDSAFKSEITVEKVER
jgi:hypothetical protein